MKMTIEQLRENNTGYAWGASSLNENDLKIVNAIIEKIENTRTDSPQALDMVEYTDKYGNYYPSAILESNTYGDGLLSICQRGSAHVRISKDGHILPSISGGSFDRPQDGVSFIYAGKEPRKFWTWGSAGAGASQGIYFTAEVSRFIYNARATELQAYTTQFFDCAYITEHPKPVGCGYLYTSGRYGKAWRNKRELDGFLKTYQVKEEQRNGWGNTRMLWLKKHKNVYHFNKAEFDEVRGDVYIACWNGSERPHKRIITNDTVTLHIDRSDEPRYWGGLEI